MWDVLQSQHADKIIVEPLLAEIILIPRLKTGRGLKSGVGLALQTKFWATVGVGDQLTVCNVKSCSFFSLSLKKLKITEEKS